ncbi:D-Ala-D-Ala carboxypeptidase family metallohydrolase [Phenylobacterium sp.]|jgi:hypothetical protein|uniref:D-Ala-D-Ala carboxypeptidase family metallohydrolase n=1 Tax=Phenylobacterium sp. TaxID=1871053 RepID=UPI002F403DE3
MSGTWLSEHFSLEELLSSQTAARQGLDNTPSLQILNCLRVTAAQMERVRALLGGEPITVSSGYRSRAVNAAVGGSATSAHMLGWAVDFNCFRFGSPLQICRAIARSPLHFDQLIEEGTWVHLSFDPRLRREIKTKAGDGFTNGLRAAA